MTATDDSSTRGALWAAVRELQAGHAAALERLERLERELAVARRLLGASVELLADVNDELRAHGEALTDPNPIGSDPFGSARGEGVPPLTGHLGAPGSAEGPGRTHG